MATQKQPSSKAPGRFARLRDKLMTKGMAAWQYWTDGIWRDTRQVWWVNVLKTVNISVTSFTNKDLQTQACAMTYRTTLAIVPALALLFAIGRGFGFKNLLVDELFALFPGQERAIASAMSFVDGYLSQSSEGLFVGIGLVFLLWTLISLFSNVEETFNYVWGVTTGRSFWRKLTDYTAMLLILPVLLICASGLALFVSSTLQSILDFSFMTPVIKMLFDLGSVLLTWLFFAACYKLFPNTKVKWVNALIAGALAGTGFLVLQWLFVSGQLYVTKYNAIYGSFAFLPLMLIWLQLTWMVTIIGALICYSSQNIFLYAWSSEVNRISPDYNYKVVVVIMTVIAKRFAREEQPLTAVDIAERTDIPVRLVTRSVDILCDCGLVSRVIDDPKVEIFRYQPALDASSITLGLVRKRLGTHGSGNFIPGFAKQYKAIDAAISKSFSQGTDYSDTVRLVDLM